MRAFDIQRFVRAGGWLGALCLCAAAVPAWAQRPPVTAQVEVVKRRAGKQPAAAGSAADASNVVVWLKPLDDNGAPSRGTPPARQAPRLTQRDKGFEPHTLVVEVGSDVQFPNRDPFFHNVFSLFDGKRFDLGLYEAGSSRTVRFDRPGVSFLFCNIHPEMSAVVVAVDTPYFGVSERSGRVTIFDVPDGRYRMQVWYERSSSEDLKGLNRVVAISQTARSLEPIQVIDNGDFKLAHKNKYGQDYLPPASPVYTRP
jgi:plastocyanin